MQRPQQGVGAGGENGEAVDESRRARRRLLRRPAFPKPSEGERRAVAPSDQIGLLLLAFLAPLVEAIGGHQAAAAAECVAESRLLERRLGPRIDHLRANLEIRRPRRHQAPAQVLQGALPGRLATLAEHRRLLGRRDVVARREVGLLDEAELALELVAGRGQEISSAHESPLKRHWRARRQASILTALPLLQANPERGNMVVASVSEDCTALVELVCAAAIAAGAAILEVYARPFAVERKADDRSEERRVGKECRS